MIRPRLSLRAAVPPVHGGPAGEADEQLPPVRLDFSTNVNAWGPAAAALKAAREADIVGYPDPDALGPRRGAALLWGLPVERVHFAPGATELVHRLAVTFLRAGDTVLVAGPTFSEYHRASALAGARVQELRGAPPLFRLPVKAVIRAAMRARPRLVFVCSPNNPTGEELEPRALEAIADALGGGALLVLDESFRSFASLRFAPPTLPAREDVLHLRSVTKDCALAGLRAAFAVGAPPVLRALRAAQVPWSASAPAQAAAAAAIGRGGLQHLELSLRRLAAERQRLAEGLAELGWESLPSRANFLMVRAGGAGRRATALRRRGVRVRDCTSFGLPDHLRIAVRRPAEDAQLLDALKSLAGGREA